MAMMDTEKEPPVTICILYSNDEDAREALLSSLRHQFHNGVFRSNCLCLRFLNFSDNEYAVSSEISKVENVLTPERDLRADQGGMDYETFQKYLKTHTLGKVILYSAVTTSTMDVINSITPHIHQDAGIVAVAERQTCGRGRRGTTWISPLGCAMFSLLLQVRGQSVQDKMVVPIRHIAPLAVVEAITAIPGYEGLNLRLKWPNDIYHSDQIKVAGVMTDLSHARDTIYANMGFGINVSNVEPTTCINSLIADYNRANGSNLPPLKAEEIIARVINKVEELVTLLQISGLGAVLEIYYKHWLHKNQMVHLDSEDGPIVRVIGLDEEKYCHLLVETDSGITTALPDSYSFDVVKKIIKPKETK